MDRGDFRARSGRRSVSTGPINIFYFVELNHYDFGLSQSGREIDDPEAQKSYYYTDTGFIAQNKYLFASSFGLVAWFHICVKENTIKAFKMKPNQYVRFAQPLEYPKQIGFYTDLTTICRIFSLFSECSFVVSALTIVNFKIASSISKYN